MITANKAIADLKASINSVENEFKELDKIASDTSTKHQQALTDLGLGKISKDEFAKIELALKEAQDKRHKYGDQNNGVVMANRKQALANLELELQAAKDMAAQNIVDECAEFIEATRSELAKPIEQIKSVIKELNTVMNQMKKYSQNSSLQFKYDFAFNNLPEIYNRLTVLENIGTNNLDSEFITVYDKSKRFLDR